MNEHSIIHYGRMVVHDGRLTRWQTFKRWCFMHRVPFGWMPLWAAAIAWGWQSVTHGTASDVWDVAGWALFTVAVICFFAD